ncbi:MAG: hypothetical protein WCO90_11685 [Planctomycetota bacterium]
MAVVTEGEKAADAATALGYIAVTSAHGANSAQKTDWSPLAGKVVVLLPDNDEVGEQYAREVCRLLRDVSPAPMVKVARLPRLPEGGDIADLLEASADHDALRAEIDRFLDEAPPADQPPEEEPNPPDDDRPTIVIRPDEKPRITDESLALLAEDHLYRDREIVRCQPTPSGMRIVSVTPESLDDILNRRAQFATLRVDRRRGGEPEEVAACAPAWLSKNICAIQAWRHIRHLEGIYNGPVLQADKTVAGLSAGYDAATRCWFDTTEDWSELSVPPTEQEVETAVATLLDVIAEFPFCSDVDRSVWIAAILTRIARPAFEGPSPLFIFNATTPGSGKTLLANLIGLITEGYAPGMKTLPSSDEETRKLLTSSLLAGEGILVFDNVTGKVSSPALDRFLTSDVWSDRLLGSSKTVTIKNQSLAIATGNNATIVGDTTRRCFQAMLAPTEEHPENRVFQIENLPEFVRKNRRKLLIAAIRILQWHVARGCPQQKTHVICDDDGNDVVAVVKPLGSFEGWSAMVRHAVMGAGLPDPTLSSLHIFENDEDRASMRCFLEAWAEWNPDFHASTNHMIEAATEQGGTASHRLLAAIRELVGKGGLTNGKPEPQALGTAIGKFQGRNFANLRVECISKRSNSGKRWKLIRVELPRP